MAIKVNLSVSKETPSWFRVTQTQRFVLPFIFFRNLAIFPLNVIFS